MASIWFRLMMNNLGLKKACVFRKMDRICQRQWRNLCIRFVEFAVGCEQPKSHLHTLCASSYGVRLFNATKNQWIPFGIFKLSNMCNQSESEIHIEKYQSFDKWKVSIIRLKFTGQHYVTWHFRYGSIFGFSLCVGRRLNGYVMWSSANHKPNLNDIDLIGPFHLLNAFLFNSLISIKGCF